jgi:selenium-binding protein 1
LSVVSFGANTGPHNLVLSSDDNRLVVTDYFLNGDTARPHGISMK